MTDYGRLLIQVLRDLWPSVGYYVVDSGKSKEKMHCDVLLWPSATDASFQNSLLIVKSWKLWIYESLHLVSIFKIQLSVVGKQWRIANAEGENSSSRSDYTLCSHAGFSRWGPMASIQSGQLLLLTSPPPTVFGTLHTPLVSSLLLWLDLRGWPPLLCHLHHQDPFLTGGSQSCSWSRKPSWAVWLFTLRERQ